MAASDPAPRVTTVFLLRHGQTAYNVAGRLRGRAAGPELTAQGHAQADALGRLFAGVALSRVLASPLQRAVKTAEPLAHAAGLPVETVDALNDRDYGPWTGHDRGEVEQRFGSVDAAPGVESWNALRHRMRQAFDLLLATSAGPAIALVGHDATHRALLADLIASLDPNRDDIPQDNGCWNRLEWHEGHWRLAVLNAKPGDGQRP